MRTERYGLRPTTTPFAPAASNQTVWMPRKPASLSQVRYFQ
jgi:hypothetical protein